MGRPRAWPEILPCMIHGWGYCSREENGYGRQPQECMHRSYANRILTGAAEGMAYRALHGGMDVILENMLGYPKPEGYWTSRMCHALICDEVLEPRYTKGSSGKTMCGNWHHYEWTLPSEGLFELRVLRERNFG